ncbi:7725_t:CDS:2, partial [Funneliformis caledonium]
LRNGKKFGQNCIEIDSKYDLNNNKVPVLVFVTENNSDSRTPLAFDKKIIENLKELEYLLIYEGDTDIAYDEIIRLYYLQEESVFSPKDNNSECNLDPFRPPELKHKTNKGALPKAVIKSRKLLQILQTSQSNSQNETNSFASEKKNTKRARKNLRNTK